MSRENVEIVRRAIAATAAKPPDVETINALYSPDHVLTSDWGVEGRTYHGTPGFIEAMSDLDAAWREWHQEVEDILDAGEKGIVKSVAEQIFEQAEKFAGYGFNKGHAAAYAQVAYQTAYLKPIIRSNSWPPP